MERKLKGMIFKENMMMKSVLAGLLAVVMMVIAGCAESDSGDSGDSGKEPGTGGGAVTGVELNLDTLYLGMEAGNKSATLIATVFPADANQAVTWTSSDEAVAKVDQEGNVTGVKAGPKTAIITVTTADGNTATCTVTVQAVVDTVEVVLFPLTLGLAVEETKTLALTVNSAGANKTVQWKFSDPGIAKAGANTGDVSGVADGTATVTVTAVYGGNTATCEVTVKSGLLKVDSVNLAPTVLVLTVGDTAELIATVDPDTAADTTATWTSSPSGIVTVDNDGKVTCEAAGDATITVTTTSGNKTAECAVKVVPAVFSVASITDWNAAIADINKVDDGTDVKYRKFEIQITGNFDAPGITPDGYSITGACKEVRLTGSGTIGLSSTGSLIAAAENQKFVIDGPTLKGITTNTYPLVYVGKDSTVELASGTIKDNKSSFVFDNNGGFQSCGGGVFVDGGTFTMTNGTISGNQAPDYGGGGGVFIKSGIFTMEDGKINGNTANVFGGGVYIYSSGTFTMKGGTITGNTADCGGGVYIFNGGTFTMNAGAISGNTASYGGGVFIFSIGKYNGPGSGTVTDAVDNG
jgi:uncharacterized protein YjdB